jgi:hypothetical protein|tara:strand:- start:1898 stop:2056 length:159 start_codon:yes stop_codon:yes gene_type:complete
MPIEIRELLIKVRIEEETATVSESIDIAGLKQTLLKECKKEIAKQCNNLRHR